MARCVFRESTTVVSIDRFDLVLDTWREKSWQLIGDSRQLVITMVKTGLAYGAAISIARSPVLVTREHYQRDDR
jgi:hypothetical protein